MTRTGFDHLERELRAGVVRCHRAARWRWRRPVALSFATALVLAGAALAATGVIPIGESVPPSHNPADPHRDAGTVRPGTTRVLPLRAADPDGGLDWAMRVQATTRGAHCVQVARVQDGRLGVLGQDGAFNDDGRFHPLPEATQSLACGVLGSRPDAGFTITMNAAPAGGATGTFGGIEVRACGSGRPGTGPCPREHMRDIYYGFLGANVASMTYDAGDGELRTIEPLAPNGAYLIVRRTTAFHGSSVGMGGVYPLEVAREITYRDGRTCTIPERAPRVRYPACATPRPASRYTATQVSAPVRARAERVNGAWTISVSFRAPAAITSAGEAYSIFMRTPNTRNGAATSWATRRDISKGAIVTRRFGYKTHHGVYTGEVRLVASNVAGFAWHRDGPLVGRFSVRIP